jgi:hypothetical protein
MFRLMIYSQDISLYICKYSKLKKNLKSETHLVPRISDQECCLYSDRAQSEARKTCASQAVKGAHVI